MARAKKNKSQEIKSTDGRKHNKRLAPKPISTTNKLTSARQNRKKRLNTQQVQLRITLLI